MTTAESSDGIVLRLVPYRDADQVATVLTRAHGKLTALARGARRSRKRFGAGLGPLVLSQLLLRPPARGELWTVESAEILRDWTAIAGDVVAFAHAGYAVELIRELVPAEVPEPAILDLAVALHDSLAAIGPSPAALRAFELALLDVLGTAPVLDACASCGRADELDLPGTVFDPGRGGAICPRCAPASRGPWVRPLPPGARAYLVAARDVAAPAEARGLDAPGPGEHAEAARVDHAAARDAMIGMITHLLGRPLRSLEFIAKLQAAARRGPAGPDEP